MLYQNYLVVEQEQSMNGIFGWYLRKVLKKDKIKKQVSALFDKAIKSNKPRYFYNGAFLNTKYMKEHASLTNEDYVNILREYRGRVLAITGKSDIQADYRVLNSISLFDGVTVYTPQGVNYVLRKNDSETNVFNIKKEYRKVLKKDIYQGVKDTIENWLNEL